MTGAAARVLAAMRMDRPHGQAAAIRLDVLVPLPLPLPMPAPVAASYSARLHKVMATRSLTSHPA
jgi:hypothetical protein